MNEIHVWLDTLPFALQIVVINAVTFSFITIVYCVIRRIFK